MNVSGVVVAAGAGNRFGGAKHSTTLTDRPLWEWARDAMLDAGVDEVVVVGPVPGGVEGGDRRRDSVANGLDAISAGARYVLVHDAARPLASPALARSVIARLLVGDCDGVIPVLAMRDTLKRIEADMVVETVEREGLVAVQTPQGFVAETLRKAHATVSGDATDDASLVEAAGGAIATVAGEPHNLKVTFPQDLAVAAALLSSSSASDVPSLSEGLIRRSDRNA